MCELVYNKLREKYGNYYRVTLDQMITSEPDIYELNTKYIAAYRDNITKLVTENEWIIMDISIDINDYTMTHTDVLCPDCGSNKRLYNHHIINYKAIDCQRCNLL